MQELIGRKPVGDRFLAPITPLLYSSNQPGGTAEAEAGRRLLALANTLLSVWQQLTGWRLPAGGEVACVLLLHRLAFEAELKGQFRRADFLWREAFERLRLIWTCIDCWDAARTLLGDGAPGSAEALRERVASELFVDTHAAFVNGRLNQECPLPVGDRAFAHLAYLRNLLKLDILPPAEAASLLAPGVKAEIAALESAKQWDTAISRAEQHLALSGGDVEMQDQIARLHFMRAIGQLSGKPEGNELADADQLGKAIQQLERLRCASPDSTLPYELIGQLHHLRSIRLANGGHLADALVVARQAQSLKIY